MKHLPHPQGGEQWNDDHCGVFTATGFSRVITAKKWELAAGRRAYQLEKLTELALGISLHQVTTQAMQSGHDWEPKARAAYELFYGVDVEPCGFCISDDGRIGASPDGFVGDEGLLEIKCPFKPDFHMGYLLNPDSLKDEYFIQVQGQLYVTGRQWTDLISYFGGLPMVTIRILPHPEFQDKLDAALKTVLREFSDLVELAKSRGIQFPESQQSKAPLANPVDLISEADLDQILELRRRQGGPMPPEVDLIANPTILTPADLDEILRLRKK